MQTKRSSLTQFTSRSPFALVNAYFMSFSHWTRDLQVWRRGAKLSPEDIDYLTDFRLNHSSRRFPNDDSFVSDARLTHESTIDVQLVKPK